MKYPKLKENEVLVLKRCIQDSKSSNDFIYPKKGMVEAPDWKATDACGHGLHGWTYGFDSYFDGKLNGNFIVILVNKNDGYIELVDKVKFRKGRVLLNTPDAQEAHSFMSHYYPKMALHWATQTAKYSSIQKTGNYSTQTAGYQSTQTAGYCSTQQQEVSLPKKQDILLPKQQATGLPKKQEITLPKQQDISLHKQQATVLPKQQEVSLPKKQ